MRKSLLMLLNKRIIVLILIFSLSWSYSFSHASKVSQHTEKANNISFKIGLVSGYRLDNLDWSITSSQNSNNIISELEYNDMEIWETEIYSTLVIKNIYIQLRYSKGNIFDGEGTDTDYEKNGEMILTHKSQFSVKNDQVEDISMGIGYQFKFLDDLLTIIPLLGLSRHKQELRMTDGKWVHPYSGAISGLDSTYETEWEGWWSGVKSFYALNPQWEIYCSLKYSESDYEAEANWNLREDFAHPKSFEHEADGYGVTINGGLSYNIYKNLDVGLDYLWRDWKAEDGIDRLYLQNGDVIKSELDEVNWESQSFRLNLSYKF